MAHEHALGLVLALCLAACGDDSSGSGTLIGADCKVSKECDVQGTCLTDGLDGICTLPCRVPGGAMECPPHTYCDRGQYSSDLMERSEMTVCLPACDKDGDCREGYSCNGVSGGGPGKICRPASSSDD